MTIDEAILDEIQKRNQPMDRDRALNILQNGLLPQVHGAYHEALDMAIKALEQEPCEDAISRQEVLEEINRIGINAFVTYNDYSGLFDFVDTLPSVTPATENDKFLEFLWNTINPNEMEQYLAMYHAKEEKTNG